MSTMEWTDIKMSIDGIEIPYKYWGKFEPEEYESGYSTKALIAGQDVTAERDLRAIRHFLKVASSDDISMSDVCMVLYDLSEQDSRLITAYADAFNHVITAALRDLLTALKDNARLLGEVPEELANRIAEIESSLVT